MTNLYDNLKTNMAAIVNKAYCKLSFRIWNVLFLKIPMDFWNPKLAQKVSELSDLITVNRGEWFWSSANIKGANKDLGWKLHDCAQSFVLRSYTMHELRNQHASIG